MAEPYLPLTPSIASVIPALSVSKIEQSSIHSRSILMIITLFAV